ncbi:MAG: hypothetical protein CL878_00255 [Dehalococcoidia bacterium]|nr:hypothetical protein [Dehalococcoidia bacterium]
MKLIWAIVQNADAGRAIEALVEQGHRVTRINTVGGFLRRGNVTLLIGVDSEQVDPAIETLRAACRAEGASDHMPLDAARAVVFVINAEGFLHA